MRWIAVLLLAATSAPAEEDWPYAQIAESCFSRMVVGADPHDCIGDAARACKVVEPAAVTIAGSEACLLEEAAIWDALLNMEYALAQDFASEQDEDDLKRAPEFAVRAEQLLAAQRAWLSFRDANCEMISGVWGSGTLSRTEEAACLLRLTAERTFALRAYRMTTQ